MFRSLDATYQAVDDVVNCSDDVGDSPVMSGESGRLRVDSVKCTSTVLVLWFKNEENRAETYELMAGAAGSAGSVYFAEGQNWFVVDGSEVAIGAAPERKVDLETLAEKLDAQYTVEQ